MEKSCINKELIKGAGIKIGKIRLLPTLLPVKNTYAVLTKLRLV